MQDGPKALDLGWPNREGARRRPHQCCARRRRLQLWPPPALARRAFARPVAGALHSALGSTTGLKPAAPSYFTSDYQVHATRHTSHGIDQWPGNLAVLNWALSQFTAISSR